MSKTVLLCLLAGCLSSVGSKPANDWTNLLDEKLSHWDVYLSYAHDTAYDGKVPLDRDGNALPAIGKSNRGVFTTSRENGDLILRVSGEYYGCISTKSEYRNYHLKAMVKWGELKYEPRKDKLRDSGILYHSIGPNGADYWRSWMLSQEFQLMEGHFGDYWNIANSAIDIRAYLPEGVMNPIANEKQLFLPFGPGSANGGFCLRSENHESPAGEWTQVELICFEGQSLHIVNGKVVMVLKNSRYVKDGKSIPLVQGKIQLQSEAAETFFKDVQLKPLAVLPAKFSTYFN